MTMRPIIHGHKSAQPLHTLSPPHSSRQAQNSSFLFFPLPLFPHLTVCVVAWQYNPFSLFPPLRLPLSSCVSCGYGSRNLTRTPPLQPSVVEGGSVSPIRIVSRDRIACASDLRRGFPLHYWRLMVI